jgi:hypothetical protein
MSARDLLADALDLFERRPTAHTTGTLARDSNNHPVAATSRYAACWCTHGILLKTADTGSLDHPDVAEASGLLQRAAVEFGFLSVTKCNDGLGRAGAVAMAARALELHDQAVPVLEGATA